MPISDIAGKVQTVLGPVEPDSLGPTTTHEHLLIDFRVMYRDPLVPAPGGEDMSHQEITLQNRGWIHYNHYSSYFNLLLDDVDLATDEVRLFRQVGGGAIVDVTTIGIGRDPVGLARVSEGSGVPIVMGAGFYVDMVHPEDMHLRSEEDLTRKIVEDIEDGVDGTGVRAGLIGEVGCTWPLTDNERKSLRASAAAQRETGAAILIHPGRHDSAPLEIIEILANAGADVSRVIMGHLDRTIENFETLASLASIGCFLEWDLFGNELSHYPLSHVDMPSDGQRMDVIGRAVTELDCADRIVLGHDICTRHRLSRYGGHGYGHIFQNIVPRLRTRGFTDAQVQAITTHNPARILTFV